MAIKPMYEIGDFVRVKDLDTLKTELGNHIENAQCGWAYDMNQYAGGEYMVTKRIFSRSRGSHYSYQFEGINEWYFSEDTLEPMPEKTFAYEAMSYSELMG